MSEPWRVFVDAVQALSIHQLSLIAAASVLGVALVVAFVLLRRGRRSPLQRALQRCGSAVLADLRIPDPVEGRVDIDFLVLTPESIVLVDVRDYEGLLFGGEHTDVWTQMLRGKSFYFGNPLHHMRVLVEAVRQQVGKVPVRGLVVFTDAGRFPRGCPAGAVELQHLENECAKHQGTGEVPAVLLKAWQGLQRWKN